MILLSIFWRYAFDLRCKPFMLCKINGFMLHCGTGWLSLQVIVTFPIFRRPNRPRCKPTPAIRANIAQNRIDTVSAKRAFKTANPRIERVRL